MNKTHNEAFTLDIVDVWGKPTNKVATFNKVAMENVDFLRTVHARSSTRSLGRDCKANGITLEKHSNDNLMLSFKNVSVVFSYGEFTAFSVCGTRFFSVEYATYSNTTTNHVNQFMNSDISRCYSNKKRFNECNNQYNWFENCNMPITNYKCAGVFFANETVSIDTKGV